MSETTTTISASDWMRAAHLVARITVLFGLALVCAGVGRSGLVLISSTRGMETLATIEATTPRSIGGGWVDLSWQDLAGEVRRAPNVEVSRRLARKLRLGGTLSRTLLRLRYRPDEPRATLAPTVVVVDDIGENVRRASSIAIGGFLAVTAGSLIILALLLMQSRGAAGRSTFEVRS